MNDSYPSPGTAWAHPNPTHLPRRLEVEWDPRFFFFLVGTSRMRHEHDSREPLPTDHSRLPCTIQSRGSTGESKRLLTFHWPDQTILTNPQKIDRSMVWWIEPFLALQIHTHLTPKCPIQCCVGHFHFYPSFSIPLPNFKSSRLPTLDYWRFEVWRNHRPWGSTNYIFRPPKSPNGRQYTSAFMSVENRCKTWFV